MTRHLDDTFVVLAAFPTSEVPAGFVAACEEAVRHGATLAVILVKPKSTPSPVLPPKLAGVELVDEAGRVRTLFDVGPGAVYLIRPDGHVSARWRSLEPGVLADALATALAGQRKGPFDS